MLSSFVPVLYATVVIILLWQAFRVMTRGFSTLKKSSNSSSGVDSSDTDRTGRLTIHPELLDQEGRITDEELLTVRFSGDIDPPQSAERSAE